MRLIQASFQNFRNIPLAHLRFEGNAHFLLGSNGQGKTNCLEGINLLTALRSFRTHEMKALVRHGEKQARLLFEIEHERLGEVEVELRLTPSAKELFINKEKIQTFSSFVGTFPCVVLCSEDLMLLRGSPSIRRRFLDLTLASMDADYLIALRRYAKALQERNAFLRMGAQVAALRAFEVIMADSGICLIKKRTEGVRLLSQTLEKAYGLISVTAEEMPNLLYKPDITVKETEALLEIFEKNRERDRIMKATQRGPHRDDMAFVLKEKTARLFASEGQQRSLVSALRYAQMHYFQMSSGVLPIVLADDVLGQLDPQRRVGFWNAFAGENQIIATGTVAPEGQWQVWNIKDGNFCDAEKHFEDRLLDVNY